MKKILSVLVVSSLLVACGSGSDGSGSSLPPDYTTVGGVTFHPSVSSNGKVKGNIAYTEKMAEAAKTFLIADDAKSIMLNGEKIDLMNDEHAFKDNYSKNVFLAGVEYSVEKKFYFIGGNPTQQMPDQGGAKYILGGNKGYLDVTFAGENKGVKGKILGAEVKADISGNTFQGTHKYDSLLRANENYETHIRGGFYGKEAAETAGLYSAKRMGNGEVIKYREGTFYGIKQ